MYIGRLGAKDPGLGVAALCVELIQPHAVEPRGLWGWPVGYLGGWRRPGSCREDSGTGKGLHLAPSASWTTPASWALLLMLERHLALLPLAGSAEFYLSLFWLLTSLEFRPLPSPQLRISGLIPAQECNYLSSCPHPGECKSRLGIWVSASGSASLGGWLPAPSHVRLNWVPACHRWGADSLLL